jgi:hypothetical protein
LATCGPIRLDLDQVETGHVCVVLPGAEIRKKRKEEATAGP